MSLRALAEALYEAMKRVDDLNRRLAQAPLEERDHLLLRLKKAQTEANQLKNRLEAKKSQG